MEIPEGFEELKAKVYRRGDELLIVAPGLVFGVLLKPQVEAGGAPEAEEEAEDPGPPPPGFEWTGEVRPPKKDEYFWSDIKGQVVRAIMDESGVNQLGEPTGGRRILRPVGTRPSRPRLRLVKDE